MSSTETPFPSRCAAIPSSAPIVMIPVPPMPATTIEYGLSSGGSAGAGIRAKRS